MSCTIPVNHGIQQLVWLLAYFTGLDWGKKNGIDDSYDLLSILPPPGNPLDHDLLRRRLTATLIDEDGDIGSESNLFLILDDVHNLDKDGARLLGVLMQVIEASNSKMIVISRSYPDFYDRRDVMTRRVSEIALGGLSQNELEMWVESMGLSIKYQQRSCMSVRAVIH